MQFLLRKLWNIYIKSPGESELFKEEFVFFFFLFIPLLKGSKHFVAKLYILLVLYEYTTYVHDCGTERILIEFLSTPHLAYQLDFSKMLPFSFKLYHFITYKITGVWTWSNFFFVFFPCKSRDSLDSFTSKIPPD